MEKNTKNVILKNIVREYISPDKTIFKAVDNIDLEIKPGEFVTLLGPSGCGKTTTLRMIAGFETPTSGEIFIGDKKVNSISPDKRDTAMVFQSYALFPHYDVYNNISFGLRLRNMDEKTISEKVSKIMDLVGLKGLETRFPNQLSGGQQQRVALARALVVEPSVLLFDEPLSNLDAKLRVSMRNEIKKIQRRVGITSIYVTHDQSEAMAISDKIIVMNNGKIEQIGTPFEIYYEPASVFVADFIGRSNFIKAKVLSTTKASTTVDIFGKKVKINDKKSSIRKEGETVTVMARPESIVPSKDGLFEVKIKSSVFMGTMQEYFAGLPNGEQIIIEDYDFFSHDIFEENDKVFVNFKTSSLHII